jgi:hypothetical protein
MGDFPFLTNAYGSFAYNMPVKSTNVKRVSNNTVYVTYDFVRDTFMANRTGHTSNHPTLLGLFGPLWRPQSSYTRYGYRKEGIIAGKYKLSSAKSLYVEDAFIDRTYSDIAFSNNDKNPLFYPGELALVNYGSREIINSDTRAIEKCLSDLASSKASMGENLAQLNQTVDLFGTIVEASTDVIRAYRALRHGNLKQLSNLNVRKLRKLVRDRKLEKRIANYWLAYWFGLKPLVSDAYGLWELMKEQSKPVLLVHGRGRSSVQHNDHFDVEPVSTLAPKYNLTGSSSVSHEYRVTGKLNDAQIARTINRAGLLNVPALAWELIPFSFVVDWVVPVGEFISNLSASSGLTFVDGSSSVRFERELLITVDSQWLMSDSVPTSHYWGFGTKRTKLLKFPTGGLYVKPFFTGASRFATIGALLSNLTRDL